MSLTNQLVTQPGFNSSAANNIARLHHDDIVPTSNTTAFLKLISSGNTIVLLKNGLVLAQTGQVTCQFFQDANQHWYCQYGEHRFELNSGMVLALDNQIWQFEIFSPPSRQEKPAFITKTLLHFKVSSDEEHICLTVKNNGKSTELGERVHHYALLLLARRYLQDKQAGFADTCCGWLDVDQLTKMIGIETSVLNVQLHRAKQQLARVLPAQPLIERRVGQIRLNTSEIEIHGGANT